MPAMNVDDDLDEQPSRYNGDRNKEVGQAAPLSGEVEKILGRPARTYAEWVDEHAAAFRNGQESNSNHDRLAAGHDRLVNTH